MQRTLNVLRAISDYDAVFVLEGSLQAFLYVRTFPEATSEYNMLSIIFEIRCQKI